MTLEEALSKGIHNSAFEQFGMTQLNDLGINGGRIPRNTGGNADSRIQWNENNPTPNLATTGPDWTFSNPTDRRSEFARAMAQITCDPSSAAQGSLLDSNHLNEELFNQIQLALAVKMGLNGPEQVKERGAA